MPHSLVLGLLPKTAIPVTHLQGVHVHGMFLELVRSLDPALSNQLHQQQVDKAFTLSPLQVETRGRRVGSDHRLQWQYRRPIPAGTPCWWRISLLDEGLFGSLAHLWLGISPSQAWRLGPAELQVTRVLGTTQVGQPWASYAPYGQIYEQASTQERRITLAFCTPTTFRQTKYDCAMPTREAVFGSLLRQWNCYAEIPFDRKILEVIYPSFFDIQTEIAIDNRSKFIGCVGVVTFQILGDIDPEEIRQVNALADFALYAGVGRKTPMGMGMVRRLQP